MNTPKRADDWGVGEGANGEIRMMTQEEALIERAKRDAEDEVWDQEFGDAGEEDLDDISDLDDE